VVDIDSPAAAFAGPANPLGFHERTDTISFNCRKVVEHAHVVSHPVPGIQLLQPPARERFTVMDVPVFHLPACSDGAVPAARTVC